MFLVLFLLFKSVSSEDNVIFLLRMPFDMLKLLLKNIIR